MPTKINTMLSWFLPDNPEQLWGSWEQRVIWVLLQSPGTSHGLPGTPVGQGSETVDPLTTHTLQKQSAFVQTEPAPGLCWRWVCPRCCSSWRCPPSSQRTSSPRPSSAAIFWTALWLRSEPGDKNMEASNFHCVKFCFFKFLQQVLKTGWQTLS